MRTVVITANHHVLGERGNAKRFVAAIDCDEFTPNTFGELLPYLLKRMGEYADPVAQKIARESPFEMMDWLLERGWKFEIYEQTAEPRMLEEPPKKETKEDGKEKPARNQGRQSA